VAYIFTYDLYIHKYIYIYIFGSMIDVIDVDLEREC